MLSVMSVEWVHVLVTASFVFKEGSSLPIQFPCPPILSPTATSLSSQCRRLSGLLVCRRHPLERARQLFSTAGC